MSDPYDTAELSDRLYSCLLELCGDDTKTETWFPVFGIWCKLRREDLRLSLEEFAQVLKVDSHWLSRLENGLLHEEEIRDKLVELSMHFRIKASKLETMLSGEKEFSQGFKEENLPRVTQAEVLSFEESRGRIQKTA